MSLPPVRVNLLKQVFQEKRLAERKAIGARLKRMAPVIAAFILLAVSATLWWQAHRAGDKLHFIEKAQQVSKQRIDRISELSKVEEGLRKQIESLNWVTEDYPMVSYRLYQIARAIPNSLWLKEVYIPERQMGRKKRRGEQSPLSKLYVVGYAHEQHEIVGFLDSLRKCECFSDVKQENTSEVRVAGEKILEFRIGLTSKPRSDGAQLAKVNLDK